MLHQTEMQVLAIVVAYNYFMNSVDRMDQIRSTVPIQRKEKRLPMIIFTFILHLAMNNARSILINLDRNSTSAQGYIISSKQKLCEQLVTPYVHFKKEQEQQKQQQRQNKYE